MGSLVLSANFTVGERKGLSAKSLNVLVHSENGWWILINCLRNLNSHPPPLRRDKRCAPEANRCFTAKLTDDAKPNHFRLSSLIQRICSAS